MTDLLAARFVLLGAMAVLVTTMTWAVWTNRE